MSIIYSGGFRKRLDESWPIQKEIQLSAIRVYIYEVALMKANLQFARASPGPRTPSFKVELAALLKTPPLFSVLQAMGFGPILASLLSAYGPS